MCVAKIGTQHFAIVKVSPDVFSHGDYFKLQNGLDG